MKKYLCLFILLILMSCTSLTASSSKISQIETSVINAEIIKVTEDLKEAASLNEYDKLKEIFLPTFKNNIILKELKKYDMSILTLTFSKAIQISKNKAQSTMIINYDSTSDYFKIIWKKEDDQWKISNVEEKS